MRGYLAFTKKEFIEGFRTWKSVVLLTVLLLIGIMNPALAKLLPWMMETLVPEGMTITLPAPTALDSWTQFFSNVSQIGLIVVLILLSTLVSGELSRGTLVNVLTKGLTRGAVVLSKLTAAVTVWTAGYLLCTLVTYAYTVYYWGSAGVVHLVSPILHLWVFSLLLITADLLGGVLTGSSYGGLLTAGGVFIALMLLNLLPVETVWNPVNLASGNMAVMTGATAPSDMALPLVISLAASLVFVLLSVVLFGKKKL